MTHRVRTSTVCRCGKPAAGGELCQQCLRRLRQRLAETPWLYRELQVTRDKQDRVTASSEGGNSKGGGKSIPLPINLDAGQAMRDLHTEILRLQVVTVQHYGATQQYRIAAICATLEQLAAKLRKHEGIADHLDRLDHLHALGIKLINPPEMKATFVAGPCPNDWPTPEGTVEPCPGQIIVSVPAEGVTDAAPMLSCGACGQSWGSIEWNRTGQRILARKQQQEQQRQLASHWAADGRIRA